MLKVYNYEGKTYDEVLENALDDLNLDEEYLIIKQIEKDDGLVHLEVIDKADIKHFIKEYITNLGNLFNLEINMEVKETFDSYSVKLFSNNNSILIGKDGRTIAAIQTLLRKTLENQVNQTIKVNVDVANYKEKNLKRLESEIKKIAYEVQKTKIDVSLDPMNSYERRAIHNMVDKIKNVTTESIGEGLNRHIVIKYQENE